MTEKKEKFQQDLWFGITQFIDFLKTSGDVDGVVMIARAKGQSCNFIATSPDIGMSMIAEIEMAKFQLVEETKKNAKYFERPS